MKYDLTYTDLKEELYKRFSHPIMKQAEGGSAYTSWLYDFTPYQDEYAEAERLNILLPLIKWCVEHNKMIEELEDELYLYYEDYREGRLDGILDPDEEKEILNDLIWSYKTYFKKEN